MLVCIRNRLGHEQSERHRHLGTNDFFGCLHGELDVPVAREAAAPQLDAQVLQKPPQIDLLQAFRLI
jgi:hypothetical protein